MKYIKFYLCALCCLCLSACEQHYTNNSIILKAEALLNSKPESAQKLLLTIVQPEKLSDADYAAWCLVYTHTQYKLFQDIKSNHNICKAINYYENSKLYKQSGTAYYLRGCIYQLNFNNKEALLDYKKADVLLNETNEEDLKGLVEYKIGYIYTQEGIFIQSINYYKKALTHFRYSKNIKYQTFTYREISNMYVQLHYPFDSIMYYSDLALKLSKEAGDSINYYSTLGLQGEILLYKNYRRSKESLLKAYRFFPSNQLNYAPFISLTYSKLNKPDSARYYMNISLKDTLNKNTKLTTLIAGAYVALNSGLFQQSFKYLEKAYNLRDTIFQQNVRSELFRIDKQYDLAQKEKENTALKIANRNKIIWITLLIIGILFIVTIALIINNRHKIKQVEQSIEKQSMEYKIKIKQSENYQKRELLVSKLQTRIENTLQFNRLKTKILQQEKLDVLIAEMTKQSTFAENELKNYIDEVNLLFNGIIISLKEKYTDLTQSDLIVIALICMKVDVSDCCNLLDMSKNTIYTRRKTIKKRIGLEKEIDLEDWLIQYSERQPSI